MKIIEYDELDSTQLEAKKYVTNNSACDGTIIVAKNQTNGIGTHGRKWIAKNNESVTFTIILQPNCCVDKLGNLTLDIAKIIVDVFRELYNINLDIEEPNDIFFNGKKIGGILTETQILDNIVKYIFIGIGLNTNQTIFDEELKNIATSIKIAFDIDVDNRVVIEKISSKLLSNY